MTSFEPPQLRQRLEHALKVWTKRIDEDALEGIPSVEDWDSDTDDSTITDKTAVTVTLRNWDDGVELTTNEFIQLVNEFEKSKFVGSVGYLSQSPPRSLWRITPQNALAHRLMSSDSIFPDDSNHREQLMALADASELHRKLLNETDSDLNAVSASHRKTWKAQEHVDACRRVASRKTERRYVTEITHQGQNFRVCLVTGFTPFALHLVESELGHEYFPPVDNSSEAFIEVTCSNSFGEEDALLLTHAYLFELSATTRAEFAIEPRQEVDEDPFGEYADELTLPNRLRPLCVGKGMTELLSIYNRGVGTSDDELRILCFAKVVEYVAQSVIRRQASEVIRGKLMSDRALSPDAGFISELEALIEQQRVFKKDKEAIKLAISHCCNATELSKLCPRFLKEFSSPELATDLKIQTSSLNRFSDVLSATRNLIAHAKANYTLTGDECPSDQYEAFAVSAKLAAEQAIRWFAVLPDSQRVV